MESSGGLLTVIVGLLLASCFVKVFTTLTILRCGLGLWQWEFGLPVLALALALTAYGMEPYVSISDYLALEKTESFEQFQQKIEPYLRSSTDPAVYSQLRDYQDVSPDSASNKTSDRGDFGLLLASFLVSQLKEAFSIGFMLLVPFLVLDVVVMNLLMVLGARQLNPDVIAIPLKILLFFSVDGWTLLAQRLLRGAL